MSGFVILQLARTQFKVSDATVDESLLERRWPDLRRSFAAVQVAWDARHAREVI